LARGSRRVPHLVVEKLSRQEEALELDAVFSVESGAWTMISCQHQSADLEAVEVFLSVTATAIPHRSSKHRSIFS
jgi:hypothetical protein